MEINYKDIEEYCRQDVIYTYNLEINYFLIKLIYFLKYLFEYINKLFIFNYERIAL